MAAVLDNVVYQGGGQRAKEEDRGPRRRTEGQGGGQRAKEEDRGPTAYLWGL